MPGLPVNSIVQVKINGTLNGEQMISGFWYQVTTAGVAASPVADLDAMLIKIFTDPTAILAKYLTCVPVTYFPLLMTAQEIAPVRSVLRETDISASVGTRGATETSNLSAVITKGADLGGRKYIGSLHLPGVATGDQNGGKVVPGLLAAMSVLGVAITSTVIPAGTGTIFSPIIPHVATPSTATTGTPLTITVPRETIRVMRRRTANVGR